MYHGIQYFSPQRCFWSFWRVNRNQSKSDSRQQKNLNFKVLQGSVAERMQPPPPPPPNAGHVPQKGGGVLNWRMRTQARTLHDQSCSKNMGTQTASRWGALKSWTVGSERMGKGMGWLCKQWRHTSCMHITIAGRVPHRAFASTLSLQFITAGSNTNV